MLSRPGRGRLRRARSLRALSRLGPRPRLRQYARRKCRRASGRLRSNLLQANPPAHSDGLPRRNRKRRDASGLRASRNRDAAPAPRDRQDATTWDDPLAALYGPNDVLRTTRLDLDSATRLGSLRESGRGPAGPALRPGRLARDSPSLRLVRLYLRDLDRAQWGVLGGSAPLWGSSRRGLPGRRTRGSHHRLRATHRAGRPQPDHRSSPRARSGRRSGESDREPR